MKTIIPINVWNNGSVQSATIFDLYIISDDLETTAVFYYELKDQMLYNLSSGNLTINGDQYQQWDADPSANEYAYNWAAQQLGLTITGDYIKPE